MALTKTDLMEIPLKDFGLPRDRKFPMQDEKHLKSAISYFYTASNEKRKELATNIVRRYNELKSDIKIFKKNPLFKYVPDEMKKLDESVSLFPTDIAKLYPILSEADKEIVESLLYRSNLGTVDDLDCMVSDNYMGKTRLLATIKSFIMNGDSDSFPVLYMDFFPTTDNLKSNNGGIKTNSSSILVNYSNSLNEAAHLDPVSNLDHITFCALLREWNDTYINGHRNLTYDRLMVESWKLRVGQLLETYNHAVKVSNHAEAEARQKLIDMGIDDVENYKYHNIVKDDMANTPVHKAAEIGYQITDDIKDKYFDSKEDDPNIIRGTLSLKLYTSKDDRMAYQTGQDMTFSREKYL